MFSLNSLKKWLPKDWHCIATEQIVWSYIYIFLMLNRSNDSFTSSIEGRSDGRQRRSRLQCLHRAWRHERPGLPVRDFAYNAWLTLNYIKLHICLRFWALSNNSYINMKVWMYPCTKKVVWNLNMLGYVYLYDYMSNRRSRCSFSMMVKWANNGKMLVNDVYLYIVNKYMILHSFDHH